MLTVAIAFVALLLPGLVLAELWRTRRLPIPADAPENVLDPVLSTAGMSRKIVFAMVALAEAFLLLIAYTANEPFRQSSAAEKQLEFAVENGAHTYIQYCMSCHGAQGRGFLENVGLPGKPLNRADLQVGEGDEGKAARKLVYTTVENGRPAPSCPAWGNQNGGPLNYAMIDEIVVLVNQGRWDVVDSFIKHDNVPIPTEPPITNPAEKRARRSSPKARALRAIRWPTRRQTARWVRRSTASQAGASPVCSTSRVTT